MSSDRRKMKGKIIWIIKCIRISNIIANEYYDDT